MTDKETMAMALEALKYMNVTAERYVDKQIPEKAITALEERLAQPEQEPCGWQFFQDGKWHNGIEVNDHRKHTEVAGIPVRDVYPAPQRTEQEPAQKPMHPEIKKMYEDYFDKCFRESQRPWVGLTAKEIDEIEKVVIGFNSLSGWENEFGLAIEAKLKEKNS